MTSRAEAELVGEPRPLRLDGVGAAHQDRAGRDERAARLWRAAGGTDHRRRAAARPRADGARGRWPIRWSMFTSANAVRAVWEKFGEFGPGLRVLRGEDRLCPASRRPTGCAPSGSSSWVPEEQSQLGLTGFLLPRADIATETLAEGLQACWESGTSPPTDRAGHAAAGHCRGNPRQAGLTRYVSPPARRCETWSASPGKSRTRGRRLHRAKRPPDRSRVRLGSMSSRTPAPSARWSCAGHDMPLIAR